MMIDIDWSKVPEGADKFNPLNGYFYMGERPNLLVWIEGPGENGQHWEKSMLCPSADQQLIALSSATVAPTQTAWDGQGFPPVGTVCQMLDADGDWLPEVEIFSHHGGFVHGWSKYSERSFFSDDRSEFRPIKTAEQIKAEERAEGIKEMCKIFMRASDEGIRVDDCCRRLYDAGYRKQEPV